MGTWLVARRNAQLLEKSLRCVRVELIQNGADDDFTMLGRWIDEKCVLVTFSFVMMMQT